MECQTDLDNNISRMSLRERPQRAKQNKCKEVKELKIMEEFIPENSNREKRKLKRKMTNPVSKNSTYDEYGHLRSNGMDLCDCLDDRCPGCWYECDTCGSNKCGVFCRVNRKIYFESIAFDGKDRTIPNKYISANK